MIFLTITFGIIAAVSLGYILILKKQMKKACREIELNRETTYNRQITIELIDRDLNELINSFNSNLEYQKKLKFAAEQSENRLKQSISDIAHDLRTPITIIKGNLQIMAKSDGLTDEELRHMAVCMEKINMLGTMIDEFYEMSYYESEDVKVSLETIDANEFLAAFLLENETLIREHNIEPQIYMPEHSVFAKADKNMLARMLTNLLTNAIRHGKSNLCISLKEDDSNIIFEFTNDADAAKNINIDKIFERTYRGDEARTGGGPGGLGLYIVKLLADKQGAQAFAREEDNQISIGIKLKNSK